MKKILLIAMTLVAVRAPLFADMCSDIRTYYSNEISRLVQETQMALSLTTDPAERTAIQQNSDMRKVELEAQMSAALDGAGCGGDSSTPPPSPDPTPAPNPEPDPTPAPDPGSGDSGGDDNGTTCAELKQTVKDHIADMKRNGESRSAQMHYLNSMKQQLKDCGIKHRRCDYKPNDKARECDRKERERCERESRRHEGHHGKKEKNCRS